MVSESMNEKILMEAGSSASPLLILRVSHRAAHREKGQHDYGGRQEGLRMFNRSKYRTVAAAKYLGAKWMRAIQNLAFQC